MAEKKQTELQKKNAEMISDENLEKVTGGSNLTLHFFDSPEQVRFIFFRGDVVLVKENFLSSTVRCVVLSSEVFYDSQYNAYEDLYIVLDPDNLKRRVLRDDIVNQVL